MIPIFSTNSSRHSTPSRMGIVDRARSISRSSRAERSLAAEYCRNRTPTSGRWRAKVRMHSKIQLGSCAGKEEPIRRFPACPADISASSASMSPMVYMIRWA